MRDSSRLNLFPAFACRKGIKKIFSLANRPLPCTLGALSPFPMQRKVQLSFEVLEDRSLPSVTAHAAADTIVRQAVDARLANDVRMTSDAMTFFLQQSSVAATRMVTNVSAVQGPPVIMGNAASLSAHDPFSIPLDEGGNDVLPPAHPFAREDAPACPTFASSVSRELAVQFINDPTKLEEVIAAGATPAEIEYFQRLRRFKGGFINTIDKELDMWVYS